MNTYESVTCIVALIVVAGLLFEGYKDNAAPAGELARVKAKIAKLRANTVRDAAAVAIVTAFILFRLITGE